MVTVRHAFYGCETGCCGHEVEWTDQDGKVCSKFKFEHPDGSTEEARGGFALRLARDATKNNNLTMVEIDFYEVSGEWC